MLRYWKCEGGGGGERGDTGGAAQETEVTGIG